MSARPPAQLSERHRLIAWLELGGASNAEIAASLGFTQSWVSTVRNSPLYKVLLGQMRDRVSDASIEGVKQKILGEAMNNVNTLIELRDNLAVEPATRRGSANDLLDRTPGLSKIHKSEVDETLRIALDADALREIQQAIAEDEGRQLPDRAVAAIATEIPSTVRARTLEEYAADYESGGD